MMRRLKLIVSLLLLATGIAACDDRPPSYTAHPPTILGTETITVFIGDKFTIGERAKILRAVNEWNVALNGVIRFDIAAETPPAGWFIVPLPGRQPNVPESAAAPYPLARAMGKGSTGVIVVYVDRMGSFDIGRVILHELGHVLGLPHQPRGLMSDIYRADDYRCIDLDTLVALAAARGMRVERFNWCEVR